MLLNKLKNIRLIFILLIMAFTQSIYAAEFAGSLDVKRIRVHDTVTYFGTDPQPVQTCNSWGEYFSFDHRSDTGKAFLSMLLTAKTSGQKIQLWYSASAAPGTDQTDGCTVDTISVVTAMALE